MPSVVMLSHTPDPESLIERAGRTCYQSGEKMSTDSAARFIRTIIRNGHESVLEHASATFLISGVSRALSHQLVRHRLASYSQQSQRYVNEDQFNYVLPSSIRENNAVREMYMQHMERTQSLYDILRDAGVPKEDARFVLPNACHTEIVMSANFRQWRHVFQERLSKAAQWEIRGLCQQIFDTLYLIAPHVFEDLKELRDGK